MLTRIKNTIRELGLLGPIAAFMVIGPAVGAVVLAATASYWVQPFLELGFEKVLLFLLGTVLLAGFSLIPTHASSLLGGMAFGTLGGIAMALLGTAGAALLGFLVLRNFCRERALAALSQRPRLEAIHKTLGEGHPARGAFLLAMIRLSPAMPFAATNLLMSTTGMGIGSFLTGSLLGMAPRVIAVAWLGSTMQELDLSQAGDQRLLLLGIVATIAVLIFFRGIARRQLAQMNL